MACDETLRTQAYVDGELDASASLEIERHIEQCAACAALVKDLRAMRSTIREQASYHRASADLRNNIMASLPVPREEGLLARLFRRSREFWAGAASSAVLSAMAAIIAVFIYLPSASSPLVEDVVNAHLRSLIPDHLIDVASSDHHTVKPWFSGHTDVSPPVADFEKEGYRLIGGRADYIDGTRAAVVVYRHGAHVINVFTWADDDKPLPVSANRSGYHLVFWKNDNLAFCAVSDTAPEELATLVRLIKSISLSDHRE